MIRALPAALLVALLPIPAFAQDTAVTSNGQRSVPARYVPITLEQRISWITDGTIGLRSLEAGLVATTWQTAWNTPEEWHRGWSGLARRYGAREADVTISNSIEAGLGAIWGEEPRYIPSRLHGFGARTRYAAKTVFLAQRRDGHLAPAWGRYVGNTLNNVVENAWLPPSITTPRQTLFRSADGFLGRFIGNMYDEFGPDAHHLLHRRR